jgi:hypothetical protein
LKGYLERHMVICKRQECPISQYFYLQRKEQSSLQSKKTLQLKAQEDLLLIKYGNKLFLDAIEKYGFFHI